MGLVRFRKGYADQDLGRVDVQRQFLSACMDQWLTLPNLVKLPQILSTVQASSNRTSPQAIFCGSPIPPGVRPGQPADCQPARLCRYD